MDKKIILVLLILLVLAIYYCYTHESFTENFENSGVGTDTTTAITNLGKLAGQLIAGGNVTIPGNLTLNTNGQNIGIGVDSRNYFRITNGAKELFVIGAGGADMYFGTGTQFGNNIVAGGSISAKGNISQGGLTIAPGTASPDNTKIQWGDGTGWRLRFQKDDKNPVMDVYDNGLIKSNYVKYVLIKGGSDYINLMQLKVMDNNNTDVAPTSFTSSSGIYDGNMGESNPINGVGNSMFHSSGGYAFYQIELQRPAIVKSIIIKNRADGYQGRLASGYRVYLFDTFRNLLFTSNPLTGDINQTIAVPAFN